MWESKKSIFKGSKMFVAAMRSYEQKQRFSTWKIGETKIMFLSFLNR